IETRTEHATVYNLTVAGYHTYYVKAADTDFLTHNAGGACGDADELADNLGENTFFHYTDGDGFDAISETGVIKPDSKNRTYLTQEALSSSETNMALHAGQHPDRGQYLIGFNAPEGMPIRKGDQVNEFIHRGSIKLSNVDLLFAGSNPFG
uniref:hypothetical protein n=1 Tax=Glycomyces salinus TaxID=980294 RepID=UPI0018EC0C43